MYVYTRHIYREMYVLCAQLSMFTAKLGIREHRNDWYELVDSTQRLRARGNGEYFLLLISALLKLDFFLSDQELPSKLLS